MDGTADETVALRSPQRRRQHPPDEEKLGRGADTLRERGHTVHIVDTAADARRLVAGLLPRGKGVFAAVSETLRRVRTYSLPRESHRAEQAYGFPSMVGKNLILEREALPDRGTVVLVCEAIGF